MGKSKYLRTIEQAINRAMSTPKYSEKDMISSCLRELNFWHQSPIISPDEKVLIKNKINELKERLDEIKF